MSVSTFFEKTKAQIKNAVSAHPIEIFLISAFAIGIWFVDMNSGKDHLAYWLFEPMLFAFIYLSRPYSWYRFSWIVPLITVFTIWQVNDNADFYCYSPKFWGANFIALLVLLGFPFEKNNQEFTYRNFINLFHLGLAAAVWLLVFGLVAAILFTITTLFNIEFSDSFYSHVYMSLGIFTQPLFFLVFQQRQVKSEMALNRIFDILVNFVLAPALIIFTVLLYAYVVQIIFEGVLPKGMLANITLPYLLGGLGVYALCSICAKAHWETFFKFYPYLAIVSIVLLWLAIDRRISAYAWTEPRIYLVALATAITIAYTILIISKIRQYRLISVVVMIAIFVMTWVVNPKEIAYQSQTERFEQLLTKLNLSDNSGKIRDDVDFVERLENMPKSELKDWEELDSVSDYLLYSIELDSSVEDAYQERREVFKKQYGEKSKELLAFNIYRDEIRINERIISDRKTTVGFEWKSIDVTPYKKWIRVPMPGFARTEVQTYMKSDEKANKHKEKPEVCFVEDHDRYRTNMDEHIHKVFKEHQLDPMKKISQAELKSLSQDLLKIDRPSFTIYLSELDMEFSQEKGYYYKELTVEAIFDK
ncbi:MAG: DUF4153 domain-containing protein [Haemophilus parainfluenzae]|uniref:DUF4153 domain-containing protein n=1 Tax=uncultured Haemophilus sp. TaxID=237779 RepID=UPI002804D982|nr:DUF4153 domain-containing protein [uncultured Haemophilus sp.]MDU4565133.1 DUF4153 domain-containing protein [Haemophilus parainfluenzae]MDU4637090.1 DUF4153 domain-containing protein [Haemophilus parainfluenzae]MDU5009410.1 DUF4153 domain-containing protein [Haemophilus parainfluenzae]MDU5990346.1 DUF4153 domain-containing protein [Haemophilus parainfluenzae]MDU7968635.1 DUF4153 domain-containing protein [Haemophilus parainfluenzae]